jgi:hypothetical protein
MPCAYRFCQMREHCEQREGTYSARADDPNVKGIPRSRGKLQASIPGTSGCGDWETLSRILNPLVLSVARGDLGYLAAQNI